MTERIALLLHPTMYNLQIQLVTISAFDERWVKVHETADSSYITGINRTLDIDKLVPPTAEKPTILCLPVYPGKELKQYAISASERLKLEGRGFSILTFEAYSKMVHDRMTMS